MKQIRIILSMAIVFFSCIALNAQTSANKSVTTDTVLYQCPMKCEGEKTYEKAGRCPKCNMNLKAISKTVAAAYQCPMKCEGDKTYDKAGKCPKCNMQLKIVKSKKVKETHQEHNHN